MMKRILSVLLALCLTACLALAEEAPQQTYEELTNTQLGLTMKYPTGWTSNPGTATLCYIEPVMAGSTGCRLAVTVKEVNKSLTKDELNDQLTGYTGAISSLYTMFSVAQQTSDSQFLNTRAASMIYNAETDNTPMSGFVTMACVNKKVYAFHFSCPSSRFDSLSGTIKELRDAITLLNN